jgi:hypothetical protein
MSNVGESRSAIGSATSAAVGMAQESGEAAKARADNTEGEVLFPVFTGAVLFLAPAGLVGLCLE